MIEADLFRASPVAAVRDRALGWTEIPCGTETILLAEDDRAVRMLTTTILQKKGYTVFPATDGEDALRVIAEQPGYFHLLITDMNMPGISGQQLAMAALLRRPGIKVLLVSGSMETMEIRDVLKQERDMRFLEKPYTPTALCLKVREVLDTL